MKKIENGYRAYHFGNFYLSSIQQGIQTAHCQTNMFLKYIDNKDSEQFENLVQWAESPVTICLNGGANEDLNDLLNFFEKGEETGDNKFAWGFFREDSQSLNGLLTNVGIILPHSVWNAEDYIKDEFFMGDHKQSLSSLVDNDLLRDCGYSEYTIELIGRIKRCGLAR